MAFRHDRTGYGVSLRYDVNLSLLSWLLPHMRSLLMRIAGAQSNAAIASALCISEQTVRNRASNLFAKLGLRSRTEAMLFSHRNRQHLVVDLRTVRRM